MSIKSNSSDKHNKRGLNALQQNLMGVIAAGVNGGPKVYASTFLCESYYRDNTEDSGVLAEMCVLLKELLTVTKEGLDVLEKCDECSKKYCDTIKGIYAEMTNEINTRVQKYEKIHSKGPLLNKLIEFPAQSMALSLRLTTRIKTTPKTEAATAPEAAAAAAATSKTTKLPEASEEKMTEAKEYVNVLEQSVRHTVIRDRPQTTLLVSTRASRRFSFSQIRGLMSAASNTNNSDVNGPEPVLMMKSLIERHPRVVKMDVESLD